LVKLNLVYEQVLRQRESPESTTGAAPVVQRYRTRLAPRIRKGQRTGRSNRMPARTGCWEGTEGVAGWLLPFLIILFIVLLRSALRPLK
jgi:hypothetical protein